MSRIDQSTVASGWKIACVGDILKIRNGFAFKSSDYVDDGISIVRQSDLDEGFVGLSNAKRVSKKFLDELPGFIVKEGDLLIGMSGSLGKISRYQEKEPALQNQRTGLLVLNKGIDPRFAKLVLKMVEPQIISEGKGIAVQNVSAKQIESCNFPLPPEEIWHSLVDEVEKQYSRLDEAVASLKRIQSNLKRYKAAVLKATVEGKLTEQWRKEHPAVEPADQLLKRILAERRARWEAEELAKMKAKGIKPKDDSWKKKYKEPAGPDTANLPELPEGWVWASVEQIANIMLGKMLDKAKHLSGNRLPYLRNVNVRWGRVETDDLFEMFFENSQLERYGLIAGDVLVCEGGEPGRAAVWNGKMPDMKYQKAIHRVRCCKGYEPRMLVVLLEHLAKSGRLEKWFTGSTIKHFTRESFVQLPVPLPSLSEQKAILEDIDRRLSVTEELEVTIEINLKRAERLRQTILQKAFSAS